LKIETDINISILSYLLI